MKKNIPMLNHFLHFSYLVYVTTILFIVSLLLIKVRRYLQSSLSMSQIVNIGKKIVKQGEGYELFYLQTWNYTTRNGYCDP